jgi:hypothetical protein
VNHQLYALLPSNQVRLKKRAATRGKTQGVWATWTDDFQEALGENSNPESINNVSSCLTFGSGDKHVKKVLSYIAKHHAALSIDLTDIAPEYYKNQKMYSFLKDAFKDRQYRATRDAWNLLLKYCAEIQIPFLYRGRPLSFPVENEEEEEEVEAVVEEVEEVKVGRITRSQTSALKKPDPPSDSTTQSLSSPSTRGSKKGSAKSVPQLTADLSSSRSVSANSKALLVESIEVCST